MVIYVDFKRVVCWLLVGGAFFFLLALSHELLDYPFVALLLLGALLLCLFSHNLVWKVLETKHFDSKIAFRLLMDAFF